MFYRPLVLKTPRRDPNRVPTFAVLALPRHLSFKQVLR